MGAILDAFANKISEKVVDQGTSGAYYLCCFNHIVADFEKGRQDLLANRESVQDLGKQAIDQNKDISKHVKHWEERADNLIQKDTKTKKTCFFGWFPDCIWRYRRAKDLKEKTKEINKLITESKDYTEFSLPSALPDVEYYSTKGFVEFESRKSASELLLDALKDGDHYMIGLWGIGGAGKTTLAIQVGKEVKESRLFDHVIKVTVSNPPIIKNIQHEIASPLGLNLESEHESDRAKRLWKRLTNGEKILIILDDVWEELNFEEIGIPSSNDHNNCRVLLTTRDIKVYKSMGCSTPIELDLLSEGDAWLLFQECAGLGKDSPKTLKNKGQKIAEECKGLPLAITTIASTLRGEEEKEWDIALRSLRSIDHNDEDLLKIYKRLKVSCDNLKGKEALELFLLCSVFPEDYEISVEDLTIYAIGLGLCEAVNSFEKARDHLHRTKKKLIESCLLLKEQKECVKMHDLLHGLAHWMQKGKIKVIMEHGSNQNALRKEIVEEKSSLRYLYYQNRNDFPDLLDCPKLEILVLEFGFGLSTINIPDTIFEGMKDLKVCTLSGYLKIPSLPKSFEELKSLRTLTLRSLSTGDISVLEKLQMLESLRLELCSFYEVPSGIVQLNKLKLLSLKHCEIKKNPLEVIGQIVLQLEELYFIRVGVNLYGQVDNEVITEFLNKCPPLKRYHIGLAPQCERWDSLNGSISSRALSIAHFGASTSNTTVNDLIKRAEILHLHKLQGGYKTIIPDFLEAVGDMNELIEIILISCSEIEFLVDTTKGFSSVGTGFSKLAKVGLMGMGHLKALCQGPPPDFLENIQKMDVGQCHKLTSLFTLPIAQSLVLLKELHIYYCEAMESLINVDSEEKGKEIVENDHDQWRLFPKLEELWIENCPQFKGLLSVDSNERQLLEVTASWIQIDFPALERLELIKLPSMISICPNNYHPKLLALQQFELMECPQFAIATIRQLDCLTRKELGNEELLNEASSVDHQAIGETKSPQRRWRWQSTCNKLRLKLFSRKKDFVEKVPKEPSSDAVRDYRSTNEVGERLEKPSDVAQKTSLQDSGMIMDTLEELRITAISEVESIFCLEVSGQDVISRLKYLILEDLCRMSYIFKSPKHILSLENLTHLVLGRCGKFKVIISTSLVRSFPKLKWLTIADCDALEKIVEEDEENQNITNPCFPSLQYILVRNCRKLKRLFCMSTLDEFPKLVHMVVAKASDLEQVFGGSDHSKREEAMQNNVLPKLEAVVLVQLPSLTNVWPYKLQTVEYLFLHNCPKLSLTSTRGVEDLEYVLRRRPDFYGDEFYDYSVLLQEIIELIVYGED